eukprot:2903808-Amphidinium_carterae.1
MAAAFADSGYGAEEQFLNYVGGNPGAVREAIHDHLKLADKKEAEFAVGHLAIAAAAFLYCLIASRIGPKTWLGIVTNLSGKRSKYSPEACNLLQVLPYLVFHLQEIVGCTKNAVVSGLPELVLGASDAKGTPQVAVLSLALTPSARSAMQMHAASMLDSEGKNALSSASKQATDQQAKNAFDVIHGGAKMSKIVTKLISDKILESTVTVVADSPLAKVIEAVRTQRSDIMNRGVNGSSRKILNYMVGVMWSALKGGPPKNSCGDYTWEQCSAQELTNFMTGVNKPPGIGNWISEQSRKTKTETKGGGKGAPVDFTDKDTV